jgi:hypothetical protein
MQHIRLIVAVSIALACPVVVGANQNHWEFEIIAETGKQFSAFYGDPAINCSGEIAFLAATPDGSGIYKASVSSPKSVHSHSGGPENYNQPAITAAGNVAFIYRENAQEGKRPNKSEFFIQSSGEILKPLTRNRNSTINRFAMNSRGTAVYKGSLGGAGGSDQGLIVYDGQRPAIILNQADGVFSSFGNNGIDINDGGQVVFTGTMQDGTHGIFMVSMAGVTTIADSSAGIDKFLRPTINNAGDVLAFGYVKIDERRSMPGLYLIRAGTITKIEGNNGLIASGSGSINDAGAIVFSGYTKNGIEKPKGGIFFGPDPEEHRVLRPGDSIDGRLITALRIYKNSLSNSGQLVLRAELEDGTEAILRATPAAGVLPQLACPRPVNTDTFIAGSKSAEAWSPRAAVGAASASNEFANPYAELLNETAKSVWLEGEKRQYRKLLPKGVFDTLVVPFLPDGDTLDAPGRTLLARLLADNLNRATGEVIPDPGIIEKILGEPMRYVPLKDILSLAGSLGVKKVLIGRVSHDRNFNMTVSMDIYRQKDGHFSGSPHREQLTRKTISFSDENLPYMAFSPIARKWATDIADAKPLKAKGGTDRLEELRWLPDSFDQIVTISKKSPLEEARQLIFLGTLFPWSIDSRSREHLFERALIVLDHARNKSGDYRLLKAQALISLNRRPASLKALGKPKTAAGKALMAYLNSNLPDLDAQIPTIKDKSLRLIAMLNRQRLRYGFDLPLDKEGAAELMDDYPIWGGFVAQRFVDSDPWGYMSNALTKTGMDALVPNVAPTIEETIMGLSVSSAIEAEAAIGRAVIDHVNAGIIVSTANNSVDVTNLTTPRQYDLFELAKSFTLATAINSSDSYLFSQGIPDAALNVLDSYAGLFAGNPQYAMMEAQIYRSPSRRKNTGRNSGADSSERWYELARQSIVWSGMQNRFNAEMSFYHQSMFPTTRGMSDEELALAFYRYDFPMRSADIYMKHRTRKDPITDVLNCVDYTLVKASCLSIYQKELFDLTPDNLRPAKKVIKDLEGRFEGHPGRSDQLIAMRKLIDADFSEETAYREALAAGVVEWKPYQYLGFEYAKRGEYEASMEAYTQYPGFFGDNVADRVSLANRAYEGGSVLYWRGAWQEARPLYAYAAGLETGSEASLASASRLALLDYDWAAAMSISIRRAERYNKAFAYRDYMTLLHFTGNSEAAWSLFDQKIKDPGGPQLWTAAYAGHRIQGARHSEIVKWAQDVQRGYTGRAVAHTDWLVARYILLAGIIDRKPPENFAHAYDELYPDQYKKREFHPERDLPDPDTGDLLYNSRNYERYPITASALEAFYNGDMESAYKLFDSLGIIRDLNEFLPYYAVAALRSGNQNRLQKYLGASEAREKEMEQHFSGPVTPFFENLVHAYMAGSEGDLSSSLQYLQDALNDRPFTENRTIFTYYQLLEVAEWLHELTGHDGYQNFIYQQASHFQIIQPMYSWSYAFAAKFAPSQAERIKNLAIAIQLDPLSWRVSQMSEEDIALARHWWEKNGDPFIKQSDNDLLVGTLLEPQRPNK